MGLLGPKPAANAAGEVFIPEPGPLLLGYPAVWEYMTNPKYDDGKLRELSKLSLFIQHAMWTVSVSDPAAKRAAYYSGASLLDCLASIDGHLSAGTAGWRKWR